MVTITRTMRRLCATIAVLFYIFSAEDYSTIMSTKASQRRALNEAYSLALQEARYYLDQDSDPNNETYPIYTDVITQKLLAEQNWRRRKGYLWMQHNRRAGGTTLCMNLRMNMMGLVQSRVGQLTDLPKHRETCQLCEVTMPTSTQGEQQKQSFCCDCNAKIQLGGPAEEHLEANLTRILQQVGRNFFEVEGNGVPDGLVSTSVWKSWVFISTLRHPIDRIISALQHDPFFLCEDSMECVANNIDKQRIFASCRQGTYHCHSNYYLRTFAGTDSNYTTDQDMMARAKQNFVRFSCVVLVDAYQITLPCLERLGLYLRDEIGAFNVDGKLNANIQGTSSPNFSNETKSINSTKTDVLYNNLPEDKIDLLFELNLPDLDFYEWARRHVLRSLEATSAL